MSSQEGEANINPGMEPVYEFRKRLKQGVFPEESYLDEEEYTIDSSTLENFLSMYDGQEFNSLKASEWTAHIPSEIIENSGFRGNLYGFIRKETKSIYIFSGSSFPKNCTVIGYIGNDLSDSWVNLNSASRNIDFVLAGCFSHDDLQLRLLQVDRIRDNLDSGYQENNFNSFDLVNIKTYNSITNLFSRNSGLLESDDMLDKCALMVGCGSVGSFAAMELARSGVGRFVLCDTDILQIHNICRHQCGFDDLGRYKVDAVKDKILNINPDAEVIIFHSFIQDIEKEQLLPFLGRDTIIIGGGDNRASSDFACRLAIETDSTFISTNCRTRAFAGEIFYWASGNNLSCYHCAFAGLIDEERPESHHTYFGSDEEKELLSFEPGIAADIDYITIIAVKLALDLINRDNDNYTPRLLEYLKQYTWICNTNSTKIGGEIAAIFPNPLWVSNNLRVSKNENCKYCGDIC